MTPRARVAAVLMLLSVAAPSLRAQVSDQSAELFTSGGLIGGLTPVSAAGRTYITPHGGARADAGIQGEQAAFGVGARFWEAARTHQVGTGGGDVFTLGEFRASRGAHTTARVTAGFSFESVDVQAPSPTAPPVAGTDGLTWSVGVARELFVPSGGLMQLSVDLVMPPGGATGDGRRGPVIEFGLAYRSRFFHRITMPGSRGSRSRNAASA